MLSFPLKLASTLHNKPRSEPTAAGARLAGDVSLQELLRGRSRKNKDPVGCSADWVCAEGSKDGETRASVAILTPAGRLCRRISHLQGWGADPFQR